MSKGALVETMQVFIIMICRYKSRQKYFVCFLYCVQHKCNIIAFYLQQIFLYGVDEESFRNQYKVEEIAIPSSYEEHMIPADYIYEIESSNNKNHPTVILVHGLRDYRYSNYPMAEFYLSNALFRRSVTAVVASIALVVLPMILTFANVLTLDVSQWLLRLTPAAGFAVQHSIPEYPHVIGAYFPKFGYYPLAPWAGFAALCGYTAIALGLATSSYSAETQLNEQRLVL